MLFDGSFESNLKRAVAQVTSEQKEGKKAEKGSLEKSAQNESPVSKFTRQEGFTEHPNLNEQTQALFAQMKRGSFNILQHPEGSVAEDPSRKGYVHAILFKSPEGKNLVKPLAGDQYKHGWTEFAARSLLKALQAELSAEKTTKEPNAIEQKLSQFNFKENTSPDPQTRAVFLGLEVGKLLSVSYPVGEIETDPGKKGFVHSILYRTADGRFFRKILNAEENKNGWTLDEANAYVKMLLETAEKGK